MKDERICDAEENTQVSVSPDISGGNGRQYIRTFSGYTRHLFRFFLQQCLGPQVRTACALSETYTLDEILNIFGLVMSIWDVCLGADLLR
jgi:hypothetical protein